MQLQIIGLSLGIATATGWFMQILHPSQMVSFFVALNVFAFCVLHELFASKKRKK